MSWNDLKDEFPSSNLYPDLLQSFCVQYGIDPPFSEDIDISVINSYTLDNSMLKIQFVRGRGKFVWIIVDEPQGEDVLMEDLEGAGYTLTKFNCNYTLCKLRKMFEWNTFKIGLVEVVSSTVGFDQFRQENFFDSVQYTTQWKLINLKTVHSYAIFIESILSGSSKTFILWKY